MPKPKGYIKEIKKSKSKYKSTAPSTVEEYLAVGVDFEEAGEKWRGGDAAKSIRFFSRAIECYNEALNKHPDSFDLAYNKARVQYELTQHPKSRQILPGVLLEYLETALLSSKSALALGPDDPDALFNTAQVLTSTVEELDGSSNSSFPNPLMSLEEALGLFLKCLQLQEVAAQDYRKQNKAMMISRDSLDLDSGDEGVSIKPTSPVNDSECSVLQNNCWATIVEPVTNDTLLDTVLASLECLTTFYQLITAENAHEIIKVESYAQNFSTKLNFDLIDEKRVIEARIIKASFTCAYASAQFCSSHINMNTYSRVIHDAYMEVDLSNDARGLCECAESLIAYNKALCLHSSKSTHEILDARWKALTKAQEHLTSASKISQTENLGKIYLIRGDVELLRFQLGQNEVTLNIARENSTVLLKNSEKYYRGSSAIAKTLGVETITFEAQVKQILASALVGERMLWEGESVHYQQERSILEEAIEDGLVTIFQLKKLGFEFVL